MTKRDERLLWIGILAVGLGSVLVTLRGSYLDALLRALAAICLALVAPTIIRTNSILSRSRLGHMLFYAFIVLAMLSAIGNVVRLLP